MVNGSDEDDNEQHLPIVSTVKLLSSSSIECTNGLLCDLEDHRRQREHQPPNISPNENDDHHHQQRSLHSINNERHGGGYSRMASSSTTFEDSMTEIIMDDVPNDNEPTSAILDYCKRKFLRPYMTILALVGLNPISTETTQLKACLSYLQAMLIMVIICFGYFLQFLVSFRGDRGFCSDKKETSNLTSFHLLMLHNWGEILFGYIIPNVLHLMGFITAIFVFKVIDNEQLQNLIERVFLMSMKPKRLCTILWVYVGLGLGFLTLLLAYVTPSVLTQLRVVQVDWMPVELLPFEGPIKIALLCTIFTQDLVEIVILTSYSIECYLLMVHLQTLSQKLLMHSIESLEWMKEVLEFRKLLDHLNNKISLPVCFYTVMNLSYALAGMVYLFKDVDFQQNNLQLVILNIANVLLWLLMGLLPFFTASSVTRVCQLAQANGHHIRIRPFVYRNTSADDLNSTLLFASSLNMSAKLFRMPIQQNYLCFVILIISIVTLTLGMCLNFSMGIF